ncbi:MAG: hypothetical protein NTW97_04010 [Candidatus Krumholzibacteria bacterium]|nr:hypothetical protein [Candidatus Krumholzibacteria bacterium]
MKWYHVLLLFVVIAAFSCSQKATIEVMNLSGGELRGSIDGNRYSLDPGGMLSEEIEIGHKFIFGTDERAITVTGEGSCVLWFSESVHVEDEDIVPVHAYNNAGLITVNNYAPYYAEVYIESCTGEAWGEGEVSSGYSVTWSGPTGCYYIEFWLGGVYFGSDTDDVYACTENIYDLDPTTRSGRLSVSKKQGNEEKVDLTGSIGALPARAKSGRLKATSPEKRLYEIIASSRGVPKSAE